jgi:hypothetical protein
MNVSLVPIDQILASDGCDGRVFGLTRVGIVRSIGELGGFACRNFSDLVVAARDAVVGLASAPMSSLSARNSGCCSRSAKTLKTSSKSPFRQDKLMVVESGRHRFPLWRRALRGSRRVDRRFGISFRPCARLRRTDRPARFGGGFVARSAANARRAVDQRQFMIFLQEDHHAVGELNALGLRRMETRQSRNRNLLPVGGLRSGPGNRRSSGGG